MNISSESRRLPNRLTLHAKEGFGKTSFGAMASGVIFAMIGGEDGLEKLIEQGQLPPTPHFDPIATWEEYLEKITWLNAANHSYRCFATDTVNGVQELLFDYVTRRDFKGNRHDFQKYAAGPDVAMKDWDRYLCMLNTLREKRGMSIILLCHTRIKGFNNPTGNNYDRYCPDMHDKMWGLTHKWSDIILFGHYEVDTKKDGLRNKATNMERRLYTSPNPAWDAKNRHGLPEFIEADATEDMRWAMQPAWNNFVSAINANRRSEAKRPSADIPAEEVGAHA